MTAAPAHMDVFSDDGPPMVDGAVLEAAKENIQPLASGRRATALAGILGRPHAKRDALLADEHQRFRAAIAHAMADDAKDADALGEYAAYVNWTVEQYPEGHVSLVPLLEEATRALKDACGGAYRQDARYLKLWAQYAALVERPELVWRFLLANDIVTTHAALYEAFATVLERAGRKQEADEIYLLGIARAAAPLDRLQAKHREFQKRMMAGLMVASSSSSGSLDSAPAPPPAAPKRKVLGDSTKRTARPAATPSASASHVPIQTPARPNGQIAIFEDEPAPDVRTAIAAGGPSTNAWPELGTRTSRVKENVREVTKMAGSTLKQKRGPAARVASSGPGFAVFTGQEEPPTPKPKVKPAKKEEAAVPATPKAEAFIPFVDEEGPTAEKLVPFVDGEDDAGTCFVPFCDNEDASPARSIARVTPGSVMKPKGLGLVASTPATDRTLSVVDDQATASEAEALRKNPLKNYQ